MERGDDAEEADGVAEGADLGVALLRLRGGGVGGEALDASMPSSRLASTGGRRHAATRRARGTPRTSRSPRLNPSSFTNLPTYPDSIATPRLLPIVLLFRRHALRRRRRVPADRACRGPAASAWTRSAPARAGRGARTRTKAASAALVATSWSSRRRVVGFGDAAAKRKHQLASRARSRKWRERGERGLKRGRLVGGAHLSVSGPRAHAHARRTQTQQRQGEGDGHRLAIPFFPLSLSVFVSVPTANTRCLFSSHFLTHIPS